MYLNRITMMGVFIFVPSNRNYSASLSGDKIKLKNKYYENIKQLCTSTRKCRHGP